MRVFYLIVFISLGFCSYSQGGWDLKYISIDSLTTDLVGRKIVIDFKSSMNDTKAGKVEALEIRRLLNKSDEVKLIVNGKEIIFVENWKIYVDQGYLNEQNLVAIYDRNITLQNFKFKNQKNEILALSADYCFKNECEKVMVNVEVSKIKGVLHNK